MTKNAGAKRRLAVTVAVFVGAALFLEGCSGGDSAAGESPSPSPTDPTEAPSTSIAEGSSADTDEGPPAATAEGSSTPSAAAGESSTLATAAGGSSTAAEGSSAQATTAEASSTTAEWSSAPATTAERSPTTAAGSSAPATTAEASSTTAEGSSTPSTTFIDRWLQGTWTTGYWDCCRPSCAWPNKGSVDSPPRLCVDGSKVVDDGLQGNPYGDVCQGGQGASCTDNMPFVVKPRLSMGFAAAAVGGLSGLNGDGNCGQCFELLFVERQHNDGTYDWGGAHPDLVGKSMIVQVNNIGYDVTGEHAFDVQIPGAGQGLFTSGCARQFSGFSSGDFDCDNNYGGCSSISGCDRLPQALQPGCEWRYTWYKWLVEGGQTNNPYVDFRRVRCPDELVQISGSTPNDDHLYPEVDLANYE